ncbi:MAG: thioredoxin family protein [Gammaproteobacteria bacterium]|nr:thioredoxin family protein [Gammaproteobacteria bacterium]
MADMTALDQFDFHGRLEDTRGAVVVLFAAPACASCRHWKRFLLDYAGTHTGLALYQVNVQQDMALAHEFGVFHLPAVYLYLDGRFHCELQSEARPELFDAALHEALQAPPQEAP